MKKFIVAIILSLVCFSSFGQRYYSHYYPRYHSYTYSHYYPRYHSYTYSHYYPRYHSYTKKSNTDNKEIQEKKHRFWNPLNDGGGEIGYSHSIANSCGYNYCNEIWCKLLFIETSVYWDTHEYNNYDMDTWTEKISDKSYTKHNTNVSQFGFFGMKCGVLCNPYFSCGLVFSLGADEVYCEEEYTHLGYIHENYNTWEIGTLFTDKQESKFGGGIYAKGQIPFVIHKSEHCKHYLCPFISAQICTNNDNTISLGINYMWNIE